MKLLLGRWTWRMQEDVLAGVSGSLLAGLSFYGTWLSMEILLPCNCLVSDSALEGATTTRLSWKRNQSLGKSVSCCVGCSGRKSINLKIPILKHWVSKKRGQWCHSFVHSSIHFFDYLAVISYITLISQAPWHIEEKDRNFSANLNL